MQCPTCQLDQLISTVSLILSIKRGAVKTDFIINFVEMTQRMN